MTFSLTIDLGNAAFHPDPLRDTNGNTCGRWAVNA